MLNTIFTMVIIGIVFTVIGVIGMIVSIENNKSILENIFVAISIIGGILIASALLVTLF